MPKNTVHEGDSYDPNGPFAPDWEDASRRPKVEIVQDEPAEDATREDRRKLNESTSGELRKAQEAYDKGEGPRVVDLREDKDDDAPDAGEPSGQEITKDMHTPRVPYKARPEQADDKGGASSPGKTSSPSGTSRELNRTNSGPASPSSAPSTAGPSTTGRTGSSTAPSAATKSPGSSGKAR